MRLTVATWNLNHSRKAEEYVEYLQEEHGVDLFLLQEMPRRLGETLPGAVVFEELGTTRHWGTGIYSPSLPIARIEFDNACPGCVAAAEVEARNGGPPVKLVSLCGHLEKGLHWVTRTLHRMLSDLTPIIMRGGKKRQRVVLGGDFNASTQFDEGKYPSHRLVLERLEDMGLESCAGWPRTEHLETFRHPNSPPFQGDYLFASGRIRSGLTAEVLDNGEIRAMSDHNPIVATFEI